MRDTEGAVNKCLRQMLLFLGIEGSWDIGLEDICSARFVEMDGRTVTLQNALLEVTELTPVATPEMLAFSAIQRSCLIVSDLACSINSTPKRFIRPKFALPS